MTAFLTNLYLRAIAVRDREEGQTMAEYGLILVFIALVAVVGATALGTDIKDALTSIGGKL